MAVIPATYENFDELIAGNTAVVDFWATWCPPCKVMSPLLEELSEEMPDVQFVSVDVDDQEGLTGKYEVMAMPTFIVFRDGEIAGRYVGAVPKGELKEKIELALS